MDETKTPSDARESWALSLAFWLTLLAAATAYALVVLSPKLLTFARLRQEFQTTQLRLVRLEHESSDLTQVIEALERDPDFVRRLANVDFGTRQKGEERIPVAEPLQISIRDNDPVFEFPSDATPWPTDWLHLFAINARCRGAALLTSVVLLLFGFVFLQPSKSDWSHAAAGVETILDRYRKPVER